MPRCMHLETVKLAIARDGAVVSEWCSRCGALYFDGKNPVRWNGWWSPSSRRGTVTVVSIDKGPGPSTPENRTVTLEGPATASFPRVDTDIMEPVPERKP